MMKYRFVDDEQPKTNPQNDTARIDEPFSLEFCLVPQVQTEKGLLRQLNCQPGQDRKVHVVEAHYGICGEFLRLRKLL